MLILKSRDYIINAQPYLIQFLKLAVLFSQHCISRFEINYGWYGRPTQAHRELRCGDHLIGTMANQKPQYDAPELLFLTLPSNIVCMTSK